MKDYLKLLIDQPLKTCFILKEEKIIFSSSERGVKPIMDFYKEYGVSATPLTIVDKIMGKSAIVLAILVGAKSIVTPTISKDALALVKEYDLTYYTENIVPYIINRTKDGRCPIESSVLDIDSIEDGYKKIVSAINILMSEK
jgi:hypothetical protein